VQSEQGTTETKWTRLDGEDLHNILENLDLKPIFNGVPPQGMKNYRNVKKLWKDLTNFLKPLKVQVLGKILQSCAF